MSTLRLLTWNIAHGRGLARRVSTLDRAALERNLEAIATAIRRERPDVVALQEVDARSSWSGGIDQLAVLADATGLPHREHAEHFAIQLGRTRLRSGTALLSRHPFVATRAAPFAAAWRDNKGWVAGTLLLGEVELDVFSVHLDFLNPALRRRQARLLAGQLRPGIPTIVAGDLNSPTTQRSAIAELLACAPLRSIGPDLPTWPSRRPRWRLDRVLATPSVRTVAARVLPDRASDHCLVRVDLAVDR